MYKFFLFIYIFLLPKITFAQLVACEGANCNFCSFAVTVSNVIQFIITIMVLIAVLLLAYAGFRMVMSAGDTGAVSEAKKILVNVIIGFIIVLAAWTLVDTFLKALVSNTVDIGKLWDPVDCGGQTSAVGLRGADFVNNEEGIPGAPGNPNDYAASPAGGSVALTGNLVDYSGAKFDAGIVDNIQYISENFGLAVSGGHRTPERNAAVNGAKNSYHLSGRAGDFTGSQSQMQAGQAWAKANGAKEAIIHNAGSGTHLHVAW